MSSRLIYVKIVSTTKLLIIEFFSTGDKTQVTNIHGPTAIDSMIQHEEMP